VIDKEAMKRDCMQKRTLDLSAMEGASSQITIQGARYPEFQEKLVGR